MDYSDEELHGLVEELAVKKHLLEADHEVLDFQKVLLFSSELSTVPFDVHVPDSLALLLLDVDDSIAGIDRLLRIAQLSFMFFLRPLTVIHDKWTCISFGFGLRTKTRPWSG